MNDRREEEKHHRKLGHDPIFIAAATKSHRSNGRLPCRLALLFEDQKERSVAKQSGFVSKRMERKEFEEKHE